MTLMYLYRPRKDSVSDNDPTTTKMSTVKDGSQDGTASADAVIIIPAVTIST